MLDTVEELIKTRGLLEQCFENAWQSFHQQTRPQQDALAINAAALRENQTQVDNLVEMISSGQATGALFEMLNKKASQLRTERHLLLTEQRRLRESLAPLDNGITAEKFRKQLITFSDIIEEAQPEEIQRIMRLMVKRIEWMPTDEARFEFFAWPDTAGGMKSSSKQKTYPEEVQDRFASNVQLGWGTRTRT
jgi:hypothetical protein